jgi:flavin reductase (DIM6/NTAB) family NADH-FMN oxidoreductase RutF
MRQTVDLAHASRLINHGPTVLVGSAHGGRRNLMAAAWSMPVEFTPPRIAIVIDKKTYTRELVTQSGGFTVSLPGRAMLDATYTVGSVSGRDMPAGIDKFERYGIESFNGPVLGLPLAADCVAWLECRLIPERHTEEAYDTCFGEVVWAAADVRVFERGRWSFRDDNTELHTLHHLGAGHFAWPQRTVQAAPLVPKTS